MTQTQQTHTVYVLSRQAHSQNGLETRWLEELYNPAIIRTTHTVETAARFNTKQAAKYVAADIAKVNGIFFDVLEVLS